MVENGIIEPLDLGSRPTSRQAFSVVSSQNLAPLKGKRTAPAGDVVGILLGLGGVAGVFNCPCYNEDEDNFEKNSGSPQ